MLSDIPTDNTRIDLLQHHELLIDSRRLQVIDPSPHFKVKGFEAFTDAH